MSASLVSGSRATLIPTDAVPMFASASTLLRRTRSINEGGSPSIGGKGLAETHGCVKTRDAPVKPKNSKTEEEVSVFKMPGAPNKRKMEIVEKDTRATENTSLEMAASVQDSVKTSTRKKPRNKMPKDEGEAQTKIKKTKITKPGAAQSARKTKKVTVATKKPQEAVAEIPEGLTSTQAEDFRARAEFRGLCLEKAITRRQEWTPPKNTLENGGYSIGNEKSTGPEPLLDMPVANDAPVTRFADFLGDFGFAQEDNGSIVVREVTRQDHGEAVIKRKRIELVNAVCPPVSVEKPKRTKAPKKKPQTITGKATAPFVPLAPMTTPSLLEYFGTPLVESLPTSLLDAETPAPRRRKSPIEGAVKLKPTVVKAEKAVQKQPILLSPESAMKTAQNQQVIFGTFSQLAREDSPTFLKDLQQAIKESVLEERRIEPATAYDFLDLPSGRSRSSQVRAVTASTRLWSAASRDFDGSLIETDFVNLGDTPKPLRTMTGSSATTSSMDRIEAPLKSSEDKGGSIATEKDPNSQKDEIKTSSNVQQQPQESEATMPRSVAEAALKKRRKSKSPVKKPPIAKSRTDGIPNYPGFTDVQLSKAVAAYGFKPIKKRETMITLLEKCWESKNSPVLQELPNHGNIPQPPKDDVNNELSKQGPSKKRGRPPRSLYITTVAADTTKITHSKQSRGRPRKDSTLKTLKTTQKRKRKSLATVDPQSEAKALLADGIYDSSPPTPSPPRRRSSPKSSGQLPLKQSQAFTSSNKTTRKPIEDRTLLFSNITKAITTFPPTHDPKNLTWYEKMLMYDPIVLEDLAAWLNTEGLGRVGEDDEVSPGLVKEWCYEQSVCCLWKENLRGGPRARW